MPIQSTDDHHQGGNRAVIDLVSELMAAWNAHDVDHAVTFYAPDYQGVDVAEAGPQRGPDGIRATLTRYLRAFPDLRFTQEAALAQGNRIALFWSAQGTHRGPLMNIPPTGHRVQVRGVSLLTLADGKVKQALYIWDVAGLLRGIGLLPDL